jgi:hypothetical protein
MFVDSDVGFNYSAIYDICQHDDDLVAGAVPLREKTEEYRFNIYTDAAGYPFISPKGLICAKGLSTAFMKISRKCLEKLWQEEKNNYILNGREVKNIFECGHRDGVFYGEDINFSEKWKKLGGLMFIYPDITFTHTGLQSSSGNFHKMMLGRKDGDHMQDIINRLNGVCI